MSGPIFPVKLAAFHHALVDTGVLARLVEETNHYGLRHYDDKARILLRSPEVLGLVRANFQTPDARVRIAFPANTSFLSLCEATMLEVYDGDKNPLSTPEPLTSLTGALANAVQVELLQLLLKAKGVDIPLL